MLDIAGHWFERKSLSHGVTWLWEPHVHPILRCNIWHIRGRDRDLPVEIVHAGHEASFGRQRLLELVDAYLDRRDV